MCGFDPITLGMGAVGLTSVLSAGNASNQGQAQASAYEAAASQDESRATILQQQGYQTARRIRSQGQSNLGAANAALAASGVDVSQGTAADVRAKVMQNTEQDALNAILSADNQALDLQNSAKQKRSAAETARNSGSSSALGSLIGGAGKILTGWNKAGGNTSSSGMYGSRGVFKTSDFLNPSGS